VFKTGERIPDTLKEILTLCRQIYIDNKETFSEHKKAQLLDGRTVYLHNLYLRFYRNCGSIERRSNKERKAEIELNVDYFYPYPKLMIEVELNGENQDWSIDSSQLVVLEFVDNDQSVLFLESVNQDQMTIFQKDLK